MTRAFQQPEEPQRFLDATGAVDDIGALDEEWTRAVYVLSCMAVAAWRQLDALIEAGVIRDVRGRI